MARHPQHLSSPGRGLKAHLGCIFTTPGGHRGKQPVPYDATAGRFISADTMIPEQQGVQAWDRYAYTSNNPIRYTDPTGHGNCEEDGYNCSTNRTTATKQAFMLVVNWYFEIGPQSQTFGQIRTNFTRG